MIKTFLEQANHDMPVYISDVRNAFNENGNRHFDLGVTLYDDSVKMFDLMLPDFCSGEERAFAGSYIYATVYNLLSSLGAKKISVYLDENDTVLYEMARELDSIFQVSLPMSERSGYGKALNVNERVINTLLGNGEKFFFEILDIKEKPESGVCADDNKSIGSVFTDLPKISRDKALLGLDVGGTDIKLTASVNGKLTFFAEYDWFPAEFTRAEQLTGPIVELTKKAAAESGVEKFDAIGLSFPDVVIRNIICGGETYKTRGMRNNTELDYEKQFALISSLNEMLKEYVSSGDVMITNDGNMAAFTAAVEEAAAGKDVSRGFFAHTLGTELGSGWVRPDGSIPEIPLEVYNFIIDLGSFAQKAYEPNDVRSINNFNTFLPGTLQKYCSQSGVFRLAAKYLPEADPELWKEAWDKGFFVLDGESIKMNTAPKDMRKPALEFFINAGCSGNHPECADILREVGTYLAVTWEETQYVLCPETPERSLFGRLVKNPESFRLISEGAVNRDRDIVQYVADETLANTEMMKELSVHPKYTVAQFAQAVGGIYFAALSLL